ncbi:MAG: hypothetical protein IT215_07445 [Chitinophagaceae bacterium]|nr:hypothetical protein [Chitinophagaceae bacterium]HMN33003.1 DUF6452 family protein [Chitinophagaceae bacterium]
MNKLKRLIPILNHKLQSFLIMLTVSVMGISSCNKSNSCLTPKVVALAVGFYQKNDTTLSDTLLENANLYFGKNAQFFQNIKNANKLRITLSQSEDYSKFIFQIDSTDFSITGIDSIRIDYNRELHYISTNCGYETYFEINNIEYSHQYIDTIIIASDKVNNDVNTEHLKIVLKK